MLVFNTKPHKIYGIEYTRDGVGRERIEFVTYKEIYADVQQAPTQLQIVIYGDRVRNMLTMYSNEDIETEEIRVEVEGNLYQIISKQKFDAFEPTHYVYELELI
jgi:hypothetical protein